MSEGEVCDRDKNDLLHFHLNVGIKEERADGKKDFFLWKPNRKSFGLFDLSFKEKGGETE